MKIQSNINILLKMLERGSQLAGGLASVPGESARMAIVVISNITDCDQLSIFQNILLKG